MAAPVVAQEIIGNAERAERPFAVFFARALPDKCAALAIVLITATCVDGGRRVSKAIVPFFHRYRRELVVHASVFAVCARGARRAAAEADEFKFRTAPFLCDTRIPVVAVHARGAVGGAEGRGGRG